MNTAFMFQPFIKTYQNLRCQAIMDRINWSANNRRETRGNQGVTAYDYEHAKLLRVLAWWLGDAIKVATFHRGT